MNWSTGFLLIIFLAIGIWMVIDIHRLNVRMRQNRERLTRTQEVWVNANRARVEINRMRQAQPDYKKPVETKPEPVKKKDNTEDGEEDFIL